MWPQGTTTYDANGNLVQSVSLAGTFTHYCRDAPSRLVKTIPNHADPASQGFELGHAVELRHNLARPRPAGFAFGGFTVQIGAISGQADTLGQASLWLPLNPMTAGLTFASVEIAHLLIQVSQVWSILCEASRVRRIRRRRIDQLVDS